MMGNNDHHTIGNINSIPLLEGQQGVVGSSHQQQRFSSASAGDENVHISESTYYTQMIQEDELRSADLMSVNSTLPEVKTTTYTTGETRREKLSKHWTTFRRWTFGNRRLKSYLMTSCKFFLITYTQANNLFEIHKGVTDATLTKSIEIISYVFMAVVLISFLVRYIREVYCAWKQKPLNVIINYVEAIVFFLYFVFSTITAIIHLVYIGKSADHDPITYNSTKVGLGVFGVILNYYLIAEKAWIYYRASKGSVSLYLAKGSPIPNPNSKHYKNK